MEESNTANASLLPTELEQLRDNMSTSSIRMSTLARPENVVVFLGNTKSGKSTVINYILGNELKGVRNTVHDPITLQLTNSSANAPVIGHSITSETLYPNKYSSGSACKLKDFHIWDVPGFTDIRGPVQDITNAYNINQLFTKINSAKIVLVSDINDILHHNIDNFLLLLSNCETLLGKEIINCLNGIAFIFTKVPEKYDESVLNADFIKGMISTKINSQFSIKISNSVKLLIQHITATHNNCIGIFPLAKIDGNPYRINNQNLETVINTRQSILSDTLQKVSPTISHNSTAILFRTREDLCSFNDFDIFLGNSKQFYIQQLNGLRVNIKRYDGTEDDLININVELKLLKHKLNHLQNFVDQSTLEQVNALLIMMNEKNSSNPDILNIKMKASFLEFIDQLLTTKQCAIFKIMFESVVQILILDLTKLETELNVRKGVVTIEKSNQLIAQLEMAHAEKETKLQQKIDELERYNKQLNDRFFGKVGRHLDDIVDAVSSIVMEMKKNLLN